MGPMNLEVDEVDADDVKREGASGRPYHGA